MIQRYVRSILVALVLAIGLGSMINSGIFENWERIDPIPGSGAQILLALPDRVAVRSHNERIYSCYWPFEGACWTLMADTSIPAHPEYAIPESQFVVRDVPEGNPKELIILVNPVEDNKAEVQYALMEDGEFWIWQHNVYAFKGVWGLDTYLTFGVIGLLLGLFIGKIWNALSQSRV